MPDLKLVLSRLLIPINFGSSYTGLDDWRRVLSLASLDFGCSCLVGFALARFTLKLYRSSFQVLSAINKNERLLAAPIPHLTTPNRAGPDLAIPDQTIPLPQDEQNAPKSISLTRDIISYFIGLAKI